jgi:large subunit ribosomal protein L24
MKIKKGDTVRVMAGKDKGKEGKVLVAYPRLEKVLVEGINRVTKHEKIQTNQRGSKTGGIVTQEAPIHVSNVMILEEGRPVRVGYRQEEVVREDGRKKVKRIRISRRTGKDLD